MDSRTTIFKIFAKEFLENTKSISLNAKTRSNRGTYTHKDRALEFDRLVGSEKYDFNQNQSEGNLWSGVNPFLLIRRGEKKPNKEEFGRKSLFGVDLKIRILGDIQVVVCYQFCSVVLINKLKIK